ncbi:hypothetical protein MRS76_19170 [Rhizobiaceae bacterium n13]|uniref:Uncharacterized protein n=1 Tax=Ferirhizobium litorale TaxID=2927786 RepID=A0AAE3U2T1_9HYPH|nr:hypothetical protein [Fererhizobium litorale]MDI7864073.1 hypothetical protein [Fererhizobium litorale]MDI7924444.1 hypothetical protein [Fererhizobium litorale]
MADTRTSASSARAEAATDDLAAQIATLREDLARLTETVKAVAQEAKVAVSDEAAHATDKVRDKVREDPIFALAVTAGVAYLIGLMSRR